MTLNVLPRGLVAGPALRRDVRLAGRGQERRQHVLKGDDAVERHARLPLRRPAQEGRHAVGALPVAVLLGAERRDRGVRPGVVVRAVVGRVHDDRVVGDAELVELVEDHADVAVVLDHAVVVLALAADAAQLILDVGAEVHARRVPPEEERLAASA